MLISNQISNQGL